MLQKEVIAECGKYVNRAVVGKSGIRNLGEKAEVQKLGVGKANL